MEMTIQDLQQITQMLIKYLEKRGITKISFSVDDSYYQKIWHQDRDLDKTPTILGFLDEDIESLKSLLKDGVPTNYELERLGAVLTTLGATLNR